MNGKRWISNSLHGFLRSKRGRERDSYLRYLPSILGVRGLIETLLKGTGGQG